jgi:uncharacterized protein YkwD
MMTSQPRVTSLAAALFRRRAIILLAALLCGAALATSLRSQYIAPSTPADRAGRVESRMLDLINGDRTAASSFQETKGRANPLHWDARLAAVARAHSEEMARNGYFSHQGLDGSTPAVRVSRAGIQWRATGENIAKTGDVVQAEALFMNEPKFQHNHRGNILKPNYSHVGVGIAKAPDGALYITQEFAELR